MTDWASTTTEVLPALKAPAGMRAAGDAADAVKAIPISCVTLTTYAVAPSTPFYAIAMSLVLERTFPESASEPPASERAMIEGTSDRIVKGTLKDASSLHAADRALMPKVPLVGEGRTAPKEAESAS